MRNDDRCHSLFFKLKHKFQKCLRIGFIERCRRLVKDQKFYIFCQCFGNFYQLLFADSDIFDQSVRIFFQPYLFHKLLGTSVGFRPVNRHFLSLLIAKKHIFCDRHIRYQCEFLVDNYNTFFLTVFNFLKFTNFSIVNDVTFVTSIRVDSTEDIHQCRFTGSVFTDQCVNLTFFHLQIDIIQCFYAGKCFGNSIHFQDIFCHRSPLLTSHQILYNIRNQSTLLCSYPGLRRQAGKDTLARFLFHCHNFLCH